MGDGEKEVFFSLEEDEAVAKAVPSEAKSEPVLVAEEVPENIEILDADVIMQATGNYSVEWQLASKHRYLFRHVTKCSWL